MSRAISPRGKERRQARDRLAAVRNVKACRRGRKKSAIPIWHKHGGEALTQGQHGREHDRRLKGRWFKGGRRENAVLVARGGERKEEERTR